MLKMLNAVTLMTSETTTSSSAGGVGLGGWIGIVIAVAIVMAVVGAILGLFISKKMFTKQLKENPPINEKMVRAMFAQMGRKASEAQIRNVMRSIKQAK